MVLLIKKMDSRSHGVAPTVHHVPIYDCVYLREDKNYWRSFFLQMKQWLQCMHEGQGVVTCIQHLIASCQYAPRFTYFAVLNVAPALPISKFLFFFVPHKFKSDQWKPDALSMSYHFLGSATGFFSNSRAVCISLRMCSLNLLTLSMFWNTLRSKIKTKIRIWVVTFFVWINVFGHPAFSIPTEASWLLTPLPSWHKMTRTPRLWNKYISRCLDAGRNQLVRQIHSPHYKVHDFVKTFVDFDWASVGYTVGLVLGGSL